MSQVMEIDEKVFKEEVLSSGIPVLAYFMSEWCPTCKAVAPVVEKLSGEFSGRMKFVRIDALKNPRIAVDNTVLSTPVLITFKEGHEVKRTTGFVAEKNLRASIEEML